MLRGIRCVIAYETEQGRSWAIAKLKMMTGDDKITARFMRQDFFSYDPQFKILILGNHISQPCATSTKGYQAAPSTSSRSPSPSQKPNATQISAINFALNTPPSSAG